MTEIEHVVLTPVPQYEPAPDSEPTADRSAKVWRDHLAAVDAREIDTAT